jgi:hypothetical protein
VDKVVTALRPWPVAPSASLGKSRVEALSTAIRNPPETLHIEMDERSRVAMFVANHRSRRLIESGQD